MKEISKEIEFNLKSFLFDKTSNLNVRGYMFASKAFAKKITENNKNKCILCIGSSNS